MSLKQALSEAMKEDGSWMTRMKKDYENQLRTQREMVAMYSKQNKELEKQLRVAKLVNKKLSKDVKTTRDKWYDETALLVKSEIANRNEIVMLKEQIRCPGCPLQLEDDEELRQEIKASNHLK